MFELLRDLHKGGLDGLVGRWLRCSCLGGRVLAVAALLLHACIALHTCCTGRLAGMSAACDDTTEIQSRMRTCGYTNRAF